MNSSHFLMLLARLVVIGLNGSTVFDPAGDMRMNADAGSKGLPVSLVNSGLTRAMDVQTEQNQVIQSWQNTRSATAYMPVKEQVPANPAESPKTESFVYPNPNTGYFIVQLPASVLGKKGTVRVYDRAAQIIYSSDFIPENGDKIIVDLGGKPPDVYLLGIQTADDNRMCKFIIR